MRLLNAHDVEYLLIGGHAVGYHGYPRATADMDVWVSMRQDNAERVVKALREFGFGGQELRPDLFLKPDQIIRMGVPPLRIEIATSISGVSFEECYAERIVGVIEGIEVNLIGLKHLLANKRASGRHKDLNDLENLPTEA